MIQSPVKAIDARNPLGLEVGDRYQEPSASLKRLYSNCFR